MPQSAYITPTSREDFELITIREYLNYYQEITNKTGTQLSWNYGESAFPYDIIDQDESKNWFYLKGKTDEYRGIVIGLTENAVQVVLPDYATHADKGKANELCKFLATKLKGDLTLFNGRTMHNTKK